MMACMKKLEAESTGLPPLIREAPYNPSTQSKKRLARTTTSVLIFNQEKNVFSYDTHNPFLP